MRTLFKCLSPFLLVVLLSSCNRPTAYFQPGAREHFATRQVTEGSASSIEIAPPINSVLPVTSTPTEQLAQANDALEQVDAMVRNDSKLASDKSVQKRLDRVRTALEANSTKSAMVSGSVNAPRKMNLMERLMLKKMNKKISKQLAPANPEKSMAIKGIVALGIILLLAGILLLILTTGTGATIGVVAVLGGILLLILGLL